MFGFKAKKRNRPTARKFGIEPLEDRRVLASISGSVFHDTDMDGAFGGNDTAIAGVVVSLEGTTRRGQSVNSTASTNSLGEFEFTDLPRGEYSLSAAEVETLLDGQAFAGTEGGKVEGNTIGGIALRQNDVATGYSFSQFSASSIRGNTYRDLDRDGNFDVGDLPIQGVAVNLTGIDDRGESVKRTSSTAADGSYEFRNLRSGNYQLDAATPAGLTDGRETLGRFEGYAHSVAENGQIFNDRFESIVLGAGQNGRNYNFGEFEANSTRGLLATSFDATVVFDGTSSDDLFEFVGGTTEHSVTVNGQSQEISATQNTRIIFYGRSGADTARLTGASGVDQVELRESSAKLTGVTYQVLVYTTNNTTVQSGGGEDRALFYDSAGDDVFVADPLGATLTGVGYAHAANDFHRVYAYGSDGHDVAQLDGSQGDDRFYATAADVRLYGAGFYNYVRSFDEVHGDARSGVNDRAYLYDSAGQDIYDSTANESRFYGTSFDNYATALTESTLTRPAAIQQSSATLEAVIITASMETVPACTATDITIGRSALEHITWPSTLTMAKSIALLSMILPGTTTLLLPEIASRPCVDKPYTLLLPRIS